MPKQLPKNLATEVIGTSGLEHSGGIVTQDPLKNLQGDKGIKLYWEMSNNSSVIGAIRFLIRNWVTQADWIVHPVDQSKQAKDQALFVEECIDDMWHSWSDFIGEVLTFCDYGWSWHETVYKMRRGEDKKDSRFSSKYTDGKIGWAGLPIRGHLSWYEWKIEDDRLIGMIQNDASNAKGPILLPADKALHFRTESTYGNPEGRSLYRNAVLDWYALKRISGYENIGIERDLTGVPIMTVPAEVLQEGSEANSTILPWLEKSLGQLKRDERAYLILPPETNPDGSPTGYKFSLVASPGKHQIDTTKVKQQYRANILQSVLAQFLEFGVSQHGSFALNDSATNNFAMALGGIMDNIAETFTLQGINQLMRMNEVPHAYWPYLGHGDIETPNLKDIADYVLKLSNAGLDMTDEETAKQLRRYASLPDDIGESCGCGAKKEGEE